MPISVVTTTFNNYSDFLLTYNSAKKHFTTIVHEYIVIDSSNTNSIRDFVYKQSLTSTIPIKYFFVPPQGPYSAMNAGILNSSQYYIWILNAGDRILYLPQNLLYTLSLDPCHCFFGSVVKHHDPKSPPYGNSGFSKWSNFRLHELHPTCIIPRFVYNKIGMFNSSFPVAADLDLLIRASRSFQFSFIPEFVVSYLPGGISTRKSESLLNIFQIIFQSYKPLLWVSFLTRYFYGALIRL